MNRLFPILLFLCAMLWAKPSVFIPVVQLEGVHQDYADKVVRLTKGFIEQKNNVRVVEEGSDCDFVLQIKMQSNADGIVVVYVLTDSKKKEEVWTYKHMAYTPDDLAPIADLIAKKFPSLSKFMFGAGVSAIGLMNPEAVVTPSLDLMFHFLYETYLFSLDLNLPVSSVGVDEFNYLGGFISAAYVFEGKVVSPFVGAGVGTAKMKFDTDLYRFAGFGGNIALMLKAGVHFKPCLAVYVRYLYQVHGIQKISNDRWMNAHGWSASAQVWW